MAAVDTLPLSVQLESSEYNLGLLTRYLSLIAFVLVVYDYISYFSEERRLIWASPLSIFKVAFLINRYLVPSCLGVSFMLLSGFSGYNLTNNICHRVVIFLASLQLWGSNMRVKYLIWSGYCIIYTAGLVLFVFGGPPQVSFTWNSLFHTCIVKDVTPLGIPLWAVPLSYEGLLLIALMWNVMDRPRMSNVGIVKSLQNDGILFLLVMTGLRLLQLSFVATLKPTHYLITNNLVWAIITITLNRSILSMQKEKSRVQAQSSFLEGINECPRGISVTTAMELAHRPDPERRYSDGSFKAQPSSVPVHIETTIESFALN